MNHFAERLRFFERLPRVWVVLVCAAALAVLCLHAEREHPMRPLSEYIAAQREDPGGLAGRLVELALPIERVASDRFYMGEPGAPSEVCVTTLETVHGGPVVKEDVGERAAVFGRFGRGLEIEDARVYVARGRGTKILISAGAALLVLYMVLRRFRFDRKGGGFRERRDA